MTNKPCTHKKIKITQKDLPLCCPSENERVWDGHPRVYLDIKDAGSVVCPYCETKYVLVDHV